MRLTDAQRDDRDAEGVDATSPQPWRIYDSLEELHFTWTIATDWETGEPEALSSNSP